MRMGLLLLALAVVMLWVVPVGDANIYNSLAVEVEETINAYEAYLGEHVRDGRVDYAAMQADRAPLDAFLKLFSGIGPTDWNREKNLAWLVNLYNAATLALILDHYPDLRSIKDLGGWFTTPWEEERVGLAGELVSLDHIEHELLRPLREPRIHFALNCSAASCPPLWSQLYRPESVYAQLQEAAEAFINDPRFNRVEEGEMRLSRIFKWFGEDFGEVRGFVRSMAGDTLATQLDALGPEPRLRYLKYDWSLNDLARP